MDWLLHKYKTEQGEPIWHFTGQVEPRRDSNSWTESLVETSEIILELVKSSLSKQATPEGYHGRLRTSPSADAIDLCAERISSWSYLSR